MTILGRDPRVGEQRIRQKMPISTSDIIEACNVIASQGHLQICVTESLKGAAMAGFGAFTLGVLLGPVGMVVGGTIGSIAGARMAKHYVPLVQILANMTEDDQVKLSNHMMQVIQKLDITDALVLMSVVASPDAIAKKAIVAGLGAYYGESWA